MRAHYHLGLCVIALAVGLGACSQSDSAQQTSQSPDASQAPAHGEVQAQAAHTELSDAIVGPADAPEGLAPGNFYEVFGSNEPPSPATLDPAECEPLIFDSNTAAAWAKTPLDQTTVAMYSGFEQQWAIVELDARPRSADPAKCQSVKRSDDTQIGNITTTYQLKLVPMELDNAEDVQAVEVVTSAVALDGQDSPGDKIGRTTLVLSANAQGKHLTVVGHNIEPEVLRTLASSQIAKLDAQANR
ncbi:hypothetical protein [Corynebacterium gerontici]|uniref:DUF5642 domain-containing protein n=1 Tax=Corynebacterium gerontici TaxID=2079234 RepID=A0A3G6J725_9CORY|nr:hypothetical protein [Corynebacterium gerontici]AZA12240.1 hypothetical protein CGERO_09765 [Corynebacterium gerontici]